VGKLSAYSNICVVPFCNVANNSLPVIVVPDSLKKLEKDKRSSLFLPRPLKTKKRFITFPPGPKVIKLFTTVIYNFMPKDIVFVPGRPF
jgi:hypothetical protein